MFSTSPCESPVPQAAHHHPAGHALSCPQVPNRPAQGSSVRSGVASEGACSGRGELSAHGSSENLEEHKCMICFAFVCLFVCLSVCLFVGWL